MQEMIKLLSAIVQQTTFDAGRLGTFSPNKLRAIYRHDKLHGGRSAASAKANVPEDILETLVQKLRPLLNRYIEPENDRIGNGLVNLMGGLPQPTVADFARILVRAAATLGAERAVQLVFGWIDGEPLYFRTKALLSGVTIDHSLALEEGIQTTCLPKSSNELSAHLPAYSMHQHGYTSLLGGVMLSIDCKAEPALYKPSKSEELQRLQHTWAQGRIPKLSLDTFCEALSLACNHCVRWKFLWGDFGDLQEFNTGVFTGMSFTNIPYLGAKTRLSQEHLEQARDIHLKRHAAGQTRRGLDTALRRWMNSKQPESNLLDQFIELRIALEALYLKDPEGEMMFRLATYGAWHLGGDLEERRQYHDTLRQTYKLASKAVHASEIENRSENKALLAAAQDVCRRGILKRLEENREPNWNEMILGAGAD